MEQWRPVAGFPYEVSSLGRVRRYGGRPLKPRPRAHGYLYVCLSIGGTHYDRHISRLVCAAFHGPPPMADAHADHIDTNRQNNVATNLQWLSPQANRARRVPLRGELNPGARLTAAVVRRIRAATGTCSAVGEVFGISRGTVWDIRSGKTWAHLAATP